APGSGRRPRGQGSQARQGRGRVGAVHLSNQDPPPALSSTRSVSCAVLSQLYSLARAIPRSASSALSPASPASLTSASAIALSSSASTSMPASPTISGIDEFRPPTTGTPLAIPSSSGNPNPS